MSYSKENKKEQSNNQKMKIKIGLISQESSYINVNNIFNSYFKKSKPEPCEIKDQNRYNFSLLNLPKILISIYHFKSFEEMNNNNKIYNFFLIFIDLHNSNTYSHIEKVIDIIMGSDDNNFNKKCYIYGFFQNKENEKMSEEKITGLVESKGIEYYYNEININDIESFSKLIECTINDCNTIMIEKYLAQKHSELLTDTSNSKCIIN